MKKWAAPCKATHKVKLIRSLLVNDLVLVVRHDIMSGGKSMREDIGENVDEGVHRANDNVVFGAHQ